jgi:uncharacterized RDD family membrane protein YckC
LYCSKCGNSVEEGIAFCPSCGQPTGTPSGSKGLPAGTSVAADPVASGYSSSGYPGGGYPVAQQPVVPVAYAARGVQYAGFWLRFVAYVIDGVVMGLGFMLLFIPFAAMTGLSAALAGVHAGQDPRDVSALLGGTFFLGLLTIGALGLIGGWLYHAKMESSSWQGTLGKRALNLRVTDLNGGRVTFQKATGRHFAKIVTGLIPFGVGFMLAGFTERRQALHDMIASCLVLRDG